MQVTINSHLGKSRDGTDYKTVKVGGAGSRSTVNVSSWARFDLLKALCEPANMKRLEAACKAELDGRDTPKSATSASSQY